MLYMTTDCCRRHVRRCNPNPRCSCRLASINAGKAHSSTIAVQARGTQDAEAPTVKVPPLLPDAALAEGEKGWQDLPGEELHTTLEAYAQQQHRQQPPHGQGNSREHPGMELSEDMTRLRAQMTAAISRIRALEAQKAEAAWKLAAAAAGQHADEAGTDTAAADAGGAHACPLEAKVFKLARQLQLRTRQLQARQQRHPADIVSLMHADTPAAVVVALLSCKPHQLKGALRTEDALRTHQGRTGDALRTTAQVNSLSCGAGGEARAGRVPGCVGACLPGQPAGRDHHPAAAGHAQPRQGPPAPHEAGIQVPGGQHCRCDSGRVCGKGTAEQAFC